MYVAQRPFKFQGVRYLAGEVVPAEGFTNLRTLLDQALIKEAGPAAEATIVAVEEPEAPEPRNLTKMTRPELDNYAAELGISGADKLPKKDDVIAAIEEHEQAQAAEAEALSESDPLGNEILEDVERRNRPIGAADPDAPVSEDVPVDPAVDVVTDPETVEE